MRQWIAVALLMLLSSGTQAPPVAVPEIVAPGIVSTPRAESAPVFSPDGRELYFSRADERGRREILVSRREGNAWAAPRALPFNRPEFDDSKAALSADGRTLVFASNRPVPGIAAAAPTFLNLWLSQRTRNGWSEPVALGSEVNTPSDEDFPVLAADGTLWFASNRSGATDYRIYRSRFEAGKVTQATLFTSAISSGFGDAVCDVARDGRYLIFMSMRPGGAGAIDLYASFRGKNGEWGAGVNLGTAVNSAQLDWFGRVSPDGRYLYFSSTRTGSGDIYRVDATVIDAAR